MAQKAVQQLMLGTVLNTEAQARGTLSLLKAGGYDGIELCAFMIHPTPFVVKLLTKAAGMSVGNGGKLPWNVLIRESGLTVPSLHQYLNAIEEKPEETAAEAASFGASYVTVTGMYRFDYGSGASVRELARRLNRAGEALRKNGVGLLYHNHNAEFLRCGEGRTAFDLLLGETDKNYVNFELDTYWAADAGADTLGLMDRLGSRLKLWHINDRGSRQMGASMTPILKQDSMELGTGSMPLEALAEKAKALGVEAVILESHKNWLEGSPVKSFQKSAEFLNRHF